MIILMNQCRLLLLFVIKLQVPQWLPVQLIKVEVLLLGFRQLGVGVLQVQVAMVLQVAAMVLQVQVAMVL